MERILRLYFNRRGALPWSVDEGPGTPERLFAEVRTEAPGVTVCHPLDASDDPSEKPCAWIEYENSELATSGPSVAPIGYILPISK